MISRTSFSLIRSCSQLKCYRAGTKCLFSENVYEKYTDVERAKILNVLNEAPVGTLSNYNITKATLKRISQWKESNARVETLSDVSSIDGVTQRSAKKLFDSILEGPKEDNKIVSKIKGQILQPALDEALRKNCKTVATVNITINSVSWVYIDRDKYEVTEWKYQQLDYPDAKKMHISDIFNISWNIVQSIPLADIYIMRAEATTLRAAGSDPNNPKVLSINLQKAQMVAMIVALINARGIENSNSNENIPESESTNDLIIKQRVYFLRSTLPYRLYGTLVGNERVSTDQVVEMLLQESKSISPEKHFYISEELKSFFRRSNDLQKDMLGHCLLLGLTFMDICVYQNQKKIQRLLNNKGD